MVWNRILAHFRASSRRSARKHKQRVLRLERMERREVLASDIGAIAGMAFIDQAGDGSSLGDPPVLVDGSGDLVAPGAPGAQGIQIQLFEDTNADNQLDGGDILVGTDVTDLDGMYRFDNLAPGSYFVQQQSVPQLNTPAPTLVTVSNDGGVQTVLIDDYSLTTQSVTATSAANGSDSAMASEAIGSARDILVINTAATGQLTVFVDHISDTLSIGSLGDGVGTALIQYDGPDGTVALDATGLDGVSLAGGAVGAAAETNSGLIVLSRAENAGDSLFITVYTDGGNSSTATIPLPEDAVNFIESFVLFADFVVATGSGADFNNVGAIEASIGLSANNDAFVSIIEARRPDVVEVNLANILPVSLGGELFLDNSVDGQNNGIREEIDPGIVGITVELYQMAGPDDVVDPSSDLLLTSTVTGANGSYNFPGLDPGNYAVVVPANQFQTGAGLFGFANSTGNDPPNDPDDNVDRDDNGTTIDGGAVISGTITLVSNSEPTDDDDANSNTNTTIDFGFFPQIDLALTKSLNEAGSTVGPGGSVVFDFVVQNLGPLDATEVTVQDVFPAGLTFTGIQNASGSFTTDVNGSVVDILIGNVAAGGSATFQLTAEIAANQTMDLTNTATATGAEVDIDDSNNSDSELLDLPSADLRIVKIDLTDPATAGTQLTYEIEVTNDGPNDADGVVVTDQLPADVTFVSGDVGGDSNLVIDNGNGQITATIGPLAANTTATVTIVVAVAADAIGPLVNTASVTSTPDTDPDPDNNTASEETQIDRLVDVGISKTVTGTPVAGGSITYRINLTNDGPSQARGVSVADLLAAELTLVSDSFDPGTSGVTLTQNGQELTFDVGILEPGQTEAFSFNVLIAPSAQGNLTNTAVISTTDPDSDPSNDSGAVSVALQQQVDLVLSKSVEPGTVVPGDGQVVYTFVVSHADGSVSDATGVMVTDMIPSGLIGTVITAPTADSTDFTGGVVTVGFDSIPLGETRTFTITADVDEAAVGTITNSGSVASAGTELNPGDNSDSATLNLTPDFDVVVTKSVDDATPGPADTVTYTVALNNQGPSTAPNVVLSDTIPAGLTFVSGTLQGQAATSNGTTVTFPSIALDAGTTVNATLVFTVNASANGVITNTASIPDLSSDGERDVTNNSDSVEIDVVAEVDLSVTKSVSLPDAIVGSNLVYSIMVTNNGPSPALNVELVDTLPSGVTFVSGTGPNGQVLTAVGGVVTVDGGNLANGASFQVTINATVARGATGNQVNRVTVSSDTEEIDPGDNTATASTSIDPSSSTFSGLVFLDRNNNGFQDEGETGIPDVMLTMTGSDFLGNAVNFSITTDANGEYQFSNLAEGTYEVIQIQPVDLQDGMTILGTGATAEAVDNMFSDIELGRDADAIDFNFSERPLPLSKRLFLASS